MKKIVFYLFLILFIFNSIVLASNYQEDFIDALKEYYSGNFQKSNSEFEIIINSNEDKFIIDALYYQTLSYIKDDNIMAAKENISILKDKGYEFGKIYWELGQVYLNKKGQFDSPFYNEAKKQLEKANMFGINSPEFHNDLANAYRGLGNISAAAREMEISLKDNGGEGEYMSLASLYQESGQFEKSKDIYKKVLSLYPDNISAYLNLANILIEQKNYEQAVEYLSKAKNRDEDFTAIRYRLALAYYHYGNLEGAESEFNEVIKQSKNNYKSYYYLGKIYQDREDYAKASYYYDEAIKYNQNYALAYIALGDIYIVQENYYKAIASYSTAIEKNDKYPEGHYHLAIAYHKLNMREAAIAELRKTLHLNSDHNDARNMLNDLLEDK